MADAVAGTAAFNERYHFLIRRLHSLSGIIPVGVFLCVHLSVNASILAGGSAFQFAVDQIHNLGKLGILKAVEVCFIFIPIAFHAILGIIIWLSGRSNLMAYRYSGNIRYTLQRWTGIIALVFVLIHLWHVHWIIPGGTEFDSHAAAESAIAAMAGAWVGPVYAIGMLCAVYHLANGIWTFLITWGITIGPQSQTISGRVCIVIGVVLGILGMSSLVKFKTMDTAAPSPPAATGGHAAAFDEMPDIYVS